MIKNTCADVFNKIILKSGSSRNLDTENPPENVPYIFDNLIRTDGHTIEFLYAKSGVKRRRHDRQEHKNARRKVGWWTLSRHSRQRRQQMLETGFLTVTKYLHISDSLLLFMVQTLQVNDS
jgi:hypothetical protein